MTTWMAREIAQAPDAVERLLGGGLEPIRAAATALRLADPRWISFVARGTSDHVATYGRYLVETRLAVPASLAAASVTTIYGAPLRWTGGALIAISQSGRSPDLTAVVEAARAHGALTIAVTNDPGSPLASAAAHAIPVLAGPEHAVAATKTYVSCLAAVAALVAHVADDRPTLAALGRVPDALATALRLADPWIADSGIVAAFAETERALVTSRGYDLATALEVAIKLQETAGLFADGHSTADLEHGPVALAGPSVPVLAFRPDGPMGTSIDGALERVRVTGARPWIVGGQEAPTVLDGADAATHSLRMPLPLPDLLMPLARIIPGQILAEAVSRGRGRDPDAPAGLTKVTLTR
jgi:glucosamine--fructose-6-phosphate aminotransferase (isomerizing)